MIAYSHSFYKTEIIQVCNYKKGEVMVSIHMKGVVFRYIFDINTYVIPVYGRQFNNLITHFPPPGAGNVSDMFFFFSETIAGL